MKLTIRSLSLLLFIFLSCGKENNNGENSDKISISITSPSVNSIVQDTVDIFFDIENETEVSKLELWVDGDSTGITSYISPFSLQWNTHNHSNGSHSLFVRLYDHSGDIVDSDYFILIVNNFLAFNITFGTGDQNETGYSILQKSDSSLVILGSVDNDILLVETDRYGTINWHQSYGGSQLDKAYHIEETTDGGYIISGSTESFGFGGSDIRLTKTGSGGLIEWNTYLGSSYNEYGGQILSTTDGGYILIGDRDFQGDGNSDIWLIKTNSQGDTLWTKSFGGARVEQGSDIIRTEDGGFMILGNTSSFGNGGADIWLIKIDLNGNEQWNQTYGNGSNDYGQSILQTYDGGFIIHFIIESFGDGNTSVGLLRVNVSGDELWTKAFGGTYSTKGNAIQQIDINDYIFTCSVFNYGDNAYNAWIININDTGEIIWDRILGGSSNDYGLSVIRTLDNGFALAGSTNKFSNGDTNSSDLWLIKTDPKGYTNDFSN